MPRKIKILYCIETIGSGGVEQTRLTLAKYLSKDKYEIKMTCSHATGPIADALRAEGVELFPLGSMKHPFDIRVHVKALRVLVGFRPDIIHGGVFEGNSIAALSGSLFRVPVRILEETSDPQNRSPRATWLLRQYSKTVDMVTAISPNVGRYLTDLAKLDLGKVSIINNGVPLPKNYSAHEKEQIKTELGLNTEEVVIGFVGRMYNDHKRMTDLLDSIKVLEKLKIRLLMVGDGRDRTLVETKIIELGIQEKVLMVGYQSDPNPYYAVMDVLCIPSAREGFGLVAAEAMLHRLPVVGSRVGGLVDVVLEGETGFLVSPGNVAEFSARLEALILSPALREQMGEAGYKRAFGTFTAERYCKDIEGLYSKMLKKKNIIQ